MQKYSLLLGMCRSNQKYRIVAPTYILVYRRRKACDMKTIFQVESWKWTFSLFSAFMCMYCCGIVNGRLGKDYETNHLFHYISCFFNVMSS